VVKVAIHQSQYMPWAPYFKKIAAADVFVVMDNVQFQKNGVQNRNMIKNKNGSFWITIPVTGHLHDLIINKKLCDNKWQEKHWRSLLAAYAKAPFWHLYADSLQSLFEKKYLTLGEVNKEFLTYLIEMLQIKTKILYLSEMFAEGSKSDLVLDICRKCGASVYLSGKGSKEYLQVHAFRQYGISIEFKESIPPQYKQFRSAFIPGLSILDMMFNVSQEEIHQYLEDKQ
jgi:hypothetical protein